jgi:hypothetical protein
LSATARADSDLPGPIPAALVRVIDGDTVEVRARIWLDLDSPPACGWRASMRPS